MSARSLCRSGRRRWGHGEGHCLQLVAAIATVPKLAEPWTSRVTGRQQLRYDGAQVA